MRKGTTPLTSAKMKSHESKRRFVVAHAYERSKIPGNSIMKEYRSTGKHEPSPQPQPLNKKKRTKNTMRKQKKEEVTERCTEIMSLSKTVSTEALNMAMDRACETICKDPSSSLAHSTSRNVLHDGLNTSINQIMSNPALYLAHVTTHETVGLALRHIGELEEPPRKKIPDSVHTEDALDEEHLIDLLYQAQAILSKHQARRRRAISSYEHSPVKRKKSKQGTRLLFRKSSSIDLIESTRKFDQINIPYDALHMPPFAKSAGPNLSRYKSTCVGDYDGKKLIDRHDTGIGVSAESLHQTKKQKNENSTNNNRSIQGLNSWPSPAIQEAVETWVERQRRNLGEAHNTTREKLLDSSGGLDYTSIEQAHELYSKTFEALLTRLDFVLVISHCGECRNHVTLRHQEDRYQLLAYDALSKLMCKCLSWRIPFRVGALTLPRRAALEMRMKRSYNQIKDAVYRGEKGEESTYNAEMTSLLLQKCCACVPVGSFEVLMACRDEWGAFHYARLFSKLESKKFPHPGGLIKRLVDALQMVLGVYPEKPLVASQDETGKGVDEPLLTVPHCAYPMDCSHGCQVNKVDNYTLEDLRSLDEISDLVGMKLQTFEPSELELGLGSTSTPQGVTWVADFSLESKHHIFSVGDVVDVKQIAPLSLSPRRKRPKSLVGLKTGARDGLAERRNHTLFHIERLCVHHTSSEGNSQNVPTCLSTQQVPLVKEPPSISKTLMDVMGSCERLSTLGRSHCSSPCRGMKPVKDSGAAQVYSPVRTAAYLRTAGTDGSPYISPTRPRSPQTLVKQSTSKSLFECGLDTRYPFVTSRAPGPLPPILKSACSEVEVEHQLPFKVSKVVERDTADIGRASGGGHEENDDKHGVSQLWYSQGFLRGIVRSAHRDGSYDIQYFPQNMSKRRNINDNDDDADDVQDGDGSGQVYIADGFPTHSGDKTQQKGFIDIGVPQSFVTTVRDRNSLQLEAETAFALRQMRQGRLGEGHSKFVFTYSNESLVKEKRSWRMEMKSSDVQARLQYCGGAYEVTSSRDDDESIGDVEDFLRGSMLRMTGFNDSSYDVDQREDPFSPCEMQAYAPIAHLS